MQQRVGSVTNKAVTSWAKEGDADSGCDIAQHACDDGERDIAQNVFDPDECNTVWEV